LKLAELCCCAVRRDAQIREKSGNESTRHDTEKTEAERGAIQAMTRIAHTRVAGRVLVFIMMGRKR
jgi:F0F1-type ATP synthase assembly protein I